MSGSVEENSVEAQGVTSPLRRIARLTAPARDAYAPTPAEINALGLLNQQGGPQMIGFLAGLQSDRTNAQDAYEQQLQQVNAQQSALARMADAREGQQQQVNLARTVLQNPNAASALTMVQPLLTPEGGNILSRFTNTALAERESKTAENNAQAQRALREPTAAGGERELTPSQRLAAFGRVEQAAEAEMRRVLAASRQPNTYTISNGTVIPMPGTAPITPEQMAAVRAAGDAARVRMRGEIGALDPRFGRLFAMQQSQAVPQQEPAVTAPQPVARTDEGSPRLTTQQLGASIASARARGNNDAAIQQRLLAAGYSAAQIQEAMRAQ